MPRYFFDIHDGFEDCDSEGTSLPSLEEARAHALQVAAAYAGKPLAAGSNGGAVIVEVRNQEGRSALVVRLVFNVDVVQL